MTGDSRLVSVNPIRDTVFASNPDLYYLIGNVLTIAASLILTGGMAANAAVSAGTSIGRAVVTEYAKQGLTVAASSYVEKSMTEATNSPLAGFVVGSLTGMATYGTLSEAELEVVNNVKRPQQLGNVGESGSKTGTVWDNITPTQEKYPYTNIPKSFEIEVNGEKMWVHGNATEHMYEEVYKGITTGNGTAYTNPNLYTQEIMSDFYGSLQEATKSGIVYGEKITEGNWEFIFAQSRQAGQLPVIKHAQFNGWH